jgi:hypothetical protein
MARRTEAQKKRDATLCDFAASVVDFVDSLSPAVTGLKPEKVESLKHAADRMIDAHAAE